MIAPWGKILRAGGRVVVLVLTPCISEGRERRGGGTRSKKKKAKKKEKKAVLQPGEHRRDVIQVRALFWQVLGLGPDGSRVW